MSAAAVAADGDVVAAGAGRGEGGKFLGQFLRAAMRAFRALPIAGADEDFAVALAFLAMKFVNRHEDKIIGEAENLKRKQRGFRLFFQRPTIKLARMTQLQRAIEESVATLRGLAALEEPLNRAAKMVLACLTSGHKLLVCGNGGSASDATHLATEFLCRFVDDRRPYPAISLTANGEFMTAVCNDYHADEIFARQIWGLAEKGDVLIAFTTSGKSKNVLRALEEAKRKGIESICFLGRDGGFTKGVATLDLLVPGDNTARIQEGHKLLFHVLCEMVEEKLPKK